MENVYISVWKIYSGQYVPNFIRIDRVLYRRDDFCVFFFSSLCRFIMPRKRASFSVMQPEVNYVHAHNLTSIFYWFAQNALKCWFTSELFIFYRKSGVSDLSPEMDSMYLLHMRRQYHHKSPKVSENAVAHQNLLRFYSKMGKSSIGRLKFSWHIGNRCRLIQWQIYDQK